MKKTENREGVYQEKRGFRGRGGGRGAKMQETVGSGGAKICGWGAWG